MNLALPAEALQVPAASFDLASVLMNPAGMQALLDFGAMMAKSAVTVPKHLQGKPADCTAICLQAAQWRMNPFAVAQKTHVSQGGALGYEAQLVNAVIVNSGALQGRPEFEFLGDWDRILGRVEERRSERDGEKGGGKYYVAAWSKADEQGLGVTVTATLTGENTPRSIRVMLTQAYPRFSTQWATDPQQQITYLALRKFARRYVPDAILGVYTIDELAAEAGTKHMGMADEVGVPPPPPPPPAPEAWPADKFAIQLERWGKAIESGVKSTDDILTLARSKGVLSAAQEAKIRAIKPKTAPADTVIDAAPRETVHGAAGTDDFVDAYERAEQGGAQ